MIDLNFIICYNLYHKMKKGRRMLLFYKVTVKNNDIYLRTSYGLSLIHI